MKLVITNTLPSILNIDEIVLVVIPATLAGPFILFELEHNFVDLFRVDLGDNVSVIGVGHGLPNSGIVVFLRRRFYYRRVLGLYHIHVRAVPKKSQIHLTCVLK